MFGGLSTDQMKKRLGIKSGALADYLPTLTIAAKNLATEMTNYNVEQKDLNLAPAEDIKKVERKVAKDEKLMQKGKSKLPK